MVTIIGVTGIFVISTAGEDLRICDAGTNPDRRNAGRRLPRFLLVSETLDRTLVRSHVDRLNRHRLSRAGSDTTWRLRSLTNLPKR